jgi:hypothetical protein
MAEFEEIAAYAENSEENSNQKDVFFPKGKSEGKSKNFIYEFFGLAVFTKKNSCGMLSA